MDLIITEPLTLYEKFKWSDLVTYFSFENIFILKHYLNCAFKQNTEAVVWRCSLKEVLLKILQNSQENTCARFYFEITLHAFPRIPPAAAYENTIHITQTSGISKF